jgi:hypothetical protein
MRKRVIIESTHGAGLLWSQGEALVKHRQESELIGIGSTGYKTDFHFECSCHCPTNLNLFNNYQAEILFKTGIG